MWAMLIAKKMGKSFEKGIYHLRRFLAENWPRIIGLLRFSSVTQPLYGDSAWYNILFWDMAKGSLSCPSWKRASIPLSSRSYRNSSVRSELRPGCAKSIWPRSWESRSPSSASTKQASGGWTSWKSGQFAALWGLALKSLRRGWTKLCSVDDNSYEYYPVSRKKSIRGNRHDRPYGNPLLIRKPVMFCGQTTTFVQLNGGYPAPPIIARPCTVLYLSSIPEGRSGFRLFCSS